MARRLRDIQEHGFEVQIESVQHDRLKRVISCRLYQQSLKVGFGSTVDRLERVKVPYAHVAMEFDGTRSGIRHGAHSPMNCLHTKKRLTLEALSH